jgi:hypothetical protein
MVPGFTITITIMLLPLPLPLPLDIHNTLRGPVLIVGQLPVCLFV